MVKSTLNLLQKLARASSAKKLIGITIQTHMYKGLDSIKLAESCWAWYFAGPSDHMRRTNLHSAPLHVESSQNPPFHYLTDRQRIQAYLALRVRSKKALDCGGHVKARAGSAFPHRGRSWRWRDGGSILRARYTNDTPQEVDPLRIAQEWRRVGVSVVQAGLSTEMSCMNDPHGCSGCPGCRRCPPRCCQLIQLLKVGELYNIRRFL